MKKIGFESHNIADPHSEAWVREMLDPDQLSTAKRTTGLFKLTARTVVLLWALRVYVVLMLVAIGFQIWNALHTRS